MRLSDFKDEKGVEVVAKLLLPIANIASNAKNAESLEKGGIAFASALLLNNAKDVMAMFAILNDKEPEEYHCDGATVLVDTFNMITDPPLMALFGLQSKTAPSSGSASENTEGQN